MYSPICFPSFTTCHTSSPDSLLRPRHFSSSGNVPSLVAFGFAARGISSSRSTLDVSTGVATTSSFSKNPLQQLPLSGGDAEDDPESRAVGPREAVCHKRGIRISPRKLNMAAKLVAPPPLTIPILCSFSPSSSCLGTWDSQPSDPSPLLSQP